MKPNSVLIAGAHDATKPTVSAPTGPTAPAPRPSPRGTVVRRSLRLAVLTVMVAAMVATTFLLGGLPTAHAAATYSVSATGEAYGPGDFQKVTVYRPSAPGRRPVAYFVHGGGWTAGGRGAWADQAYEWATHGWVTVNIEYTHAVNAGDGAQQLADVTAVVTKYEAASYTDRTRQVIVGDSAGGHLATTVGAKMRGHFTGVIAWSPVASPYNAYVDSLQPGTPANMVSLGTRAKRFYGYSFGTTSAYRYVVAYGGPPMWIAGSSNEWVTWHRQGGDLCATLRSIAPSLCESYVVPGTLHGTDVRDAYPNLEASAYSFAMHRIGAWT